MAQVETLNTPNFCWKVTSVDEQWPSTMHNQLALRGVIGAIRRDGLSSWRPIVHGSVDRFSDSWDGTYVYCFGGKIKFGRVVLI